ncbi:MAG: hypothetical protein RLO52_00820 [Sandaracinaceae bacterium]
MRPRPLPLAPPSLVMGLVMGLALPGGALAQPSLDAAERQLEQAQFERAAETLAELAESDVGLDRDAVARLLSLRAVVGQALGREGDVRRDLLGLASVLRGREPEGLPPNLLGPFEGARREVRGPPSVRLRIEPLGAELLRVTLEVEDDPGALTRETLVTCSANDREIVRSNDLELRIPAAGRVECEGVARGPGGFEVGRSAARRLAADALGDGGDPPWLWIAAGAGVAALLAIVIGVAVAASGPAGVGGPEWLP